MASREMQVALETLWACAAYIASNKGALRLSTKLDANGQTELVSNIDVELNQLAAAQLAREFPEDVIIGEEGVIIPRTRSDRFWLIDPVDGTRSFADGRPGAASVIALVEAGRVVMSAIYDISAEAYYSIDGASPLMCDGQPVAAGAPKPVLLWNPYADASLKSHLLSSTSVVEAIEIESAALRAVAMAEGRGCLMVSLPGSSKIWDSAPALPIILSKQGRYTDLLGQPLGLAHDRVVNDRGAVGSMSISHQGAIEAVTGWLSSKA